MALDLRRDMKGIKHLTGYIITGVGFVAAVIGVWQFSFMEWPATRSDVGIVVGQANASLYAKIAKLRSFATPNATDKPDADLQRSGDSDNVTCSLKPSASVLHEIGNIRLYWDSHNATGGNVEGIELPGAAGYVPVTGITLTSTYHATFINSHTRGIAHCSATVIVE
jgi:hypothetical protein